MKNITSGFLFGLFILLSPGANPSTYVLPPNSSGGFTFYIGGPIPVPINIGVNPNVQNVLPPGIIDGGVSAVWNYGLNVWVTGPGFEQYPYYSHSFFFTGMTNNTSGFPPTFLDFSANAGFFHVEVADFARTLNIEFHNDGFNTISLYSQIVITLPDGVAITPLPAALPLFVTGLGALGLFGWRRKRKAQATA